MITVGALREYLKNVPAHYTVILSNDDEGNSYSPMATEISYGKYLPEYPFNGDFEFEDKNPSSIVFFPIS